MIYVYLKNSPQQCLLIEYDSCHEYYMRKLNFQVTETVRLYWNLMLRIALTLDKRHEIVKE